MQYFIIIFISLGISSCQNPKSHTKQLSNKNAITKADSVIKEIPKFKDGQYSIFYKEAKRIADTLKLHSIDSGFDSLQIRFWYPEMSINTLIMISRIQGKWEAFQYNYSEEHDLRNSIDRIVDVKSKRMTPESGWQKFTHELFSLGITTLPDSDNIPEYHGGGTDGESYSVEIATTSKYRFYTYHEPKDHSNLEQARQMVKIITLINKEFKISGYLM